MQLTEAQHKEVAQDLVTAEETKVWTEPLSLRYDDVDIEDAYAVGQMVTDIKVANGRVIKGHKVGLTSKAMRDATNMHEPDYGTMFDNWFLDEGTQVSMGMLNKPSVEVELVFVLKENLGDIDVRHVGGALYKNGEVVESGTATATSPPSPRPAPSS